MHGVQIVANGRDLRMVVSRCYVLVGDQHDPRINMSHLEILGMIQHSNKAANEFRTHRVG